MEAGWYCGALGAIATKEEGKESGERGRGVRIARTHSQYPANRTIIGSRAIYSPEKQCKEYFDGGRIQRNNGPGGEDV